MIVEKTVFQYKFARKYSTISTTSAAIKEAVAIPTPAVAVIMITSCREVAVDKKYRSTFLSFLQKKIKGSALSNARGAAIAKNTMKMVLTEPSPFLKPFPVRNRTKGKVE